MIRIKNDHLVLLKKQLLLKKIINLLLYGNFWIAGCALALCLQMKLVLLDSISLDVLCVFAFLSTLFLYAVHRIVGISKLHEYFQVERYGVIATFKNHIRVYALVGLIGTGISFFFLSRSVQLALIIPAVISLAYVIPFLGSNRRLRDMDHIKIFLVAIVWAWVTVLLPGLEYGLVIDQNFVFLFLERMLFIFAITLPFDIRDLKVDEHSKVKTIPAQLGVINTKILGIFCLILAAILAFLLFHNDIYQFPVFLGIMLSYATTMFLIFLSDSDRHDYFYSGLIDGTMILQFLFIFVCQSLLQ